MPGNELFALPSFAAQAPSFETVMKILNTPTASYSQFIPEYQNAIGAGSQQIENQAGALSADIQGMMGKRGMTGGSIEANAVAEGVGNLRASYAADTSKAFAQLLAQARTGDVDAMRRLREMLAQASGQELTAQRSMSMFREQLQAGKDIAAANSSAAQNAAWIGAFGNIGASAMRYGFS